MRPTPNSLVEQYRVTKGARLLGPYASRFESTTEDGNNGIFLIPYGKPGLYYFCIASDGGSWEHVSVSLRKGRLTQATTPIWEQMCAVKDLFWGPEEAVVQYHPPESKYVNNHPGVLHLWKPIGIEIPMPPVQFV